MLKKISIKWLFLIAVITAGGPIWFISYDSFTTKRVILISGILTVVLALLSSLLTNEQNKKIIYTIVSGFIVATIIKIIIDSISDPSSHNLLPFEIIYYMVIAFLSAGIGVSVGLLIKRFWF